MGKKAKRSTALTVFGVIVGTLLLSGGALALARSQEDTRTLSTFDFSIGRLNDETGELPEDEIDKTGVYTKDYFKLDEHTKVTLDEDANVQYQINVYNKDKEFLSVHTFEGNFNAEYMQGIDFKDGYDEYEYCKNNVISFGERVTDVELVEYADGDGYAMKGILATDCLEIYIHKEYFDFVFNHTDATAVSFQLEISSGTDEMSDLMCPSSGAVIERADNTTYMITKERYLEDRLDTDDDYVLLRAEFDSNSDMRTVEISNILALNGDDPAKIKDNLLVRFEVIPTAEVTVDEETGEETVAELEDLNFFTKTELASKIQIEVAKD